MKNSGFFYVIQKRAFRSYCGLQKPAPKIFRCVQKRGFVIMLSMALIKTDKGIESIRGRCGGQYFKKDNSGRHIQSMPRTWRKISYRYPVIKPGSPGGSRAFYIGAFSMGSWQWLFLTCAAIAKSFPLITMWTLAAVAAVSTGIMLYKFMTNRGLFLHFAVPRIARGLPPYDLPPHSVFDLPVYVANGEFFWPATRNIYPTAEFFNGKPVFKIDQFLIGEKQFFLFFNGFKWVISQSQIVPYTIPYWISKTDDIYSTYDPCDPIFKIIHISPQKNKNRFLWFKVKRFYC